MRVCRNIFSHFLYLIPAMTFLSPYLTSTYLKLSQYLFYATLLLQFYGIKLYILLLFFSSLAKPGHDWLLFVFDGFVKYFPYGFYGDLCTNYSESKTKWLERLSWQKLNFLAFCLHEIELLITCLSKLWLKIVITNLLYKWLRLICDYKMTILFSSPTFR